MPVWFVSTQKMRMCSEPTPGHSRKMEILMKLELAHGIEGREIYLLKIHIQTYKIYLRCTGSAVSLHAQKIKIKLTSKFRHYGAFRGADFPAIHTRSIPVTKVKSIERLDTKNVNNKDKKGKKTLQKKVIL